MGCDIHAYVDYDEDMDGEIKTYNLARVSIGRNYWLFTLLAGVRGESVQGQFPVTDKKGLPQSISWQVRKDAYLMVIDTEECQHRESGCCTRVEAEKWGNYTDETKRYVNHPDWHSHSWMTLEELDEVIKRYLTLKEKKQIWLKPYEAVPPGYTLSNEEWSGMRIAYSEGRDVEVPMEILAIRGAMEAVEKSGRKCRFVFWFDN